MPRGRHAPPALHDRSLSARIVHRAPLLYAAGADVEADRPGHVRAASGIAWIGGVLAIIQDDANFIALAEPTAPGRARALALPRGPDGRRQFDDGRGNKHLKLDLEACIAVAPPESPETVLVAFGSGSTALREVAVVVRGWDAGAPHAVIARLPRLYGALRETTEFAGSELNVEGAVLVDGCLRLFGRGNGAMRGALAPVNATCDLDWAALWAHLESLGATPAPAPRNVVRHTLGELGGIPLGFTDAALWGGGASIVFTAAAEDSPDVTRDGPVHGSVVGVLHAHQPARWVPLTDAAGAPLRDKIEGVVASPGASNELLVIADPDVAEQPSELCVVRLDGSWNESGV